ncbi:hypothetical protein E4U40_003376 [Claviceps sp. LM458 group G5]|nr:hypothetical protein E4U40_003376 [Claviceps sp. LM458 group G5]
MSGGKGFTAKTQTVSGQGVGARSTGASESMGRYTRAPATKHMGVRHHGQIQGGLLFLSVQLSRAKRRRCGGWL